MNQKKNMTMKRSKAQDIYSYLSNKKAKQISDLKEKYGREYIFIYKHGNILTAFGEDAEALRQLGATINVCGRASFRACEENNYLRLIIKSGRKAAITEKI